MQNKCYVKGREEVYFFSLCGFVALARLNHFESFYRQSRCFISPTSDYVFLTALKSLNVWADYILISFFYNLQENFFSIFILTKEHGNVPFQQKGILYWSGFIMWHTSKLKGCPEHTELDLLGTVLTNAAWLTSCALEANRIADSLLFSYRSVVYAKIK